MRKDILQHMKKNIKELSSIDLEDMVEEVELRSVRAEEQMQQLYLRQLGAHNQPVPVFDYEIN